MKTQISSIARNFSQQNVYRFVLIVFVVAIPVVMAFLLPQVVFRASIFDFVPTLNDEIHYWHEILTFSQKGFSGGYYAMEEKIASAKFSPFGPHGPLFPMIYGTFGWLLEWHTYTSLIFNIVAISLSLLIFIIVSKPDNTRLIFLGALLLVFWPLHFYSISVMQESLNQAFAIGLATIFFFLIQCKGDVSPGYALFFGLIIFFSGLLRFTWAFMFLPFFLLIDCPRTLLGYLLSISKTILLISISFISWRYLSSVYEANFITELILTFQQSWLDAGKLLVNHILFNIYNLISVNNGHLIEVLQRFQILVVIVGVVAISVVNVFQTPKNRAINYDRWLQIELPFHLFNLGVFLSIQVIFYDVFFWRDYRVLSSHLLISLLLLLVFNRGRWLIGLIILSNLLFALSFFGSFKDERTSSFVYDRGGISNFEQILDQFLIYDPKQGPWCNTLLTTTFHSHLVGVPPGIGISYVVRDPSHLAFPLKSKYLLIEHDMLKESNSDYQRFRDKLKNVEFLAKTNIGNLYINLDAECE